MPADAGDGVDTVLRHLADLIHLHRPEVPPWVAQTDLTFGQLRLLFKLHRAGPTPMGHLAGWLGVGMATVTGVVERLEHHGLVVRAHREDDRRVVDCQLTAAGAALVAEVDGLRADALRQVLSSLSSEELFEFDLLLTRVIDRAGERERERARAR